MDLSHTATRLAGHAIIELLKLVREDQRNFEQTFRDTLTERLDSGGRKNERIIDRVSDTLLSDPDIQRWIDGAQLPEDLTLVEKLAGKLEVDTRFVQEFFLAFEFAIAKNPTLNTILQNRRDANKTKSLQDILAVLSGEQAEAITRQQHTVLRRYNEKIHKRFSTIMLFGERKADKDSAIERMSDIEHGFVQLHLTHWRDEGNESPPLIIDEVFFAPSLRLSLIRGLPGSGKTTLLRYLAWRFSADHAGTLRIPVYIRLKALNLGKKSLEEFIRQQLKRLCPDRETQTVLLSENFFLESPMILLLDGIDEIEDSDSRAGFAEALGDLVGDFPRCTIILTSRPTGLKKEDYPEFTPFDLDLLTPEQIDDYLRKWFAGDSAKITALQNTLDKQPRMKALASNPFLLSMICFTFDQGGDPDLIKRRSTLYAKCTEYLLARLYDPESAKPAVLSKDQTMAMLKDLALRFFLWQEADFPAAEVNVLARRVVSPKDLRLPEKFLDRMERDTGLIQRAQEGFTFVHRTLWEYFTALALRDDPKKGTGFVIRHAANPDWEEVVRLYAGLLEEDAGIRELVRGLWDINRPLALRVTTEVETPAAEMLQPLIESEAGNQGKLLLIEALAQSLPLILDERMRQPLVEETLRIMLIECQETDCEVIYYAQQVLERQNLQPLAKGGLIYELFDLGNAQQRQKKLLADPKNHFQWIEVKGGDFLMGDDEHESDEKPAHRVRVKSFRMMQHPVTNRMQREFKFGERYNHGGDDCPAIGNTWWEAYYFALWLGCRLPTEAEWEYAARGGNKRLKDGMQYYFDGGAEELPKHAWFGQQGRGRAHEVDKPNALTGKENLNPLGLANMLGNVWEWCADWYDGSYYSNSPEIDPPGPESGTQRVLRGGAYDGAANGLRCACRDGDLPTIRGGNVGFRCLQDGLVDL